MEQDKYLLELERVIDNYINYGKDMNDIPAMNAFKSYIDTEGKILLGIQRPKSGLVVDNNGIPTIKSLMLSNGSNIVSVPVFTSGKKVPKEMPIAMIPFKGFLINTLNQDFQVQIITNFNKETANYALSKDEIRCVLNHKPVSSINIIKGSVVDINATAIVNSANHSLLGGSGVDGAIHEKAGPELLEECKKLCGCEVGEAKITKAYNIKNADYIIHTVGPRYNGRLKDAKLLANCYINTLNLAKANNCQSIAFPCISTGVYGYPLKEAAFIAICAINKWLDVNKDVVMNVYFVCYTDEEKKVYNEIQKNK